MLKFNLQKKTVSSENKYWMNKFSLVCFDALIIHSIYGCRHLVVKKDKVTVKLQGMYIYHHILGHPRLIRCITSWISYLLSTTDAIVLNDSKHYAAFLQKWIDKHYAKSSDHSRKSIWLNLKLVKLWFKTRLSSSVQCKTKEKTVGTMSTLHASAVMRKKPLKHQRIHILWKTINSLLQTWMT